MLVELIALLGACIAGLAVFLVVRDSEMDQAIWLASWPLLAIEAALIVARDSAPPLGYVEQMVGPMVPALQCAGALHFVGRRSPRWLLPATVVVALARAALATFDPEWPRYALALAFDCSAYGLATWHLAREGQRQRSVRFAFLAGGIAAMALVNALNSLRALQGLEVSATFWALWTVVAIPNFAMQVGAVLSRSRGRARQALVAERRDVTNLLVGGVAHDFNNLLTAISGFAQLADADLRAGRADGARESLGEILRAVARASTITRRLLEHVEAVPRTTQRLHLGELLAGITARRNASATPVPFVQCAVQAQLPAINGDRRLIETAADLLIQNAIESGAPLPIHVGVATARTERVIRGDADTVAAPGHYVTLTVTDRGIGIPAHVRARLFQPFFTTHEVGRGLGLAAVAGIARLHAGLVRLESSTAGTNVSLWLPCSEQPVRSEDAE